MPKALEGRLKVRAQQRESQQQKSKLESQLGKVRLEGMMRLADAMLHRLGFIAKASWAGQGPGVCCTCPASSRAALLPSLLGWISAGDTLDGLGAEAAGSLRGAPRSGASSSPCLESLQIAKIMEDKGQDHHAAAFQAERAPRREAPEAAGGEDGGPAFLTKKRRI